jgi:hypothetical protein
MKLCPLKISKVYAMSHGISTSALLHIPSLIHCNDRLNTFTNWPQFGKPSKEEMAKAGFIYLGHDDWTMCAFCGVRIYAWQPYDVPFVEHNKHADQCSYLTLTYVPDSYDVPDNPGSHTGSKVYCNEHSGGVYAHLTQPMNPFPGGCQPPKFTSFGKFPK